MSKILSFGYICKVFDRICNISLNGGVHIVADGSVIIFHALADPVEHDPDKTVFIKISDKIFLRIGKSSFF